MTEKHIEAIRAVGLADAGRAQQLMNGSGKNSDETQKLADEAKEALGGYYREFLNTEHKTVGWKKNCRCETKEVKPCAVLDPFGGSGTTAFVAQQLNRDFVIVELNQNYLPLIERRILQNCLPLEG